jgi:hypothetical protein
VRRRVDTPLGTAGIEDQSEDVGLVYRNEEGPPAIGTIFVVGREAGETTYAWKASGGPDGVAASEAEAIAAILAA